jgi:hypothetical protein
MDSWLELYNWLHEYGHSGRETVVLQVPLARADYIGPREFTLSVADIKARAFDEIHPRLPLKKSVLIMHETLEEIAKFSSVNSNDLHTFLNNLLTRDK